MEKEDIEFFEGIGVSCKVMSLYQSFYFDQGILIAKNLKTKENILEFKKICFSNGAQYYTKKKTFEEQLKIVPGLSKDHSGNTFHMAISVAIEYLPKLLMDNRDEKINDIIR